MSRTWSKEGPQERRARFNFPWLEIDSNVLTEKVCRLWACRELERNYLRKAGNLKELPPLWDEGKQSSEQAWRAARMFSTSWGTDENTSSKRNWKGLASTVPMWVFPVHAVYRPKWVTEKSILHDSKYTNLEMRESIILYSLGTHLLIVKIKEYGETSLIFVKCFRCWGCVCVRTNRRRPGKARVKSKLICNIISHVFQRERLTKFQREKSPKKKNVSNFCI